MMGNSPCDQDARANLFKLLLIYNHMAGDLGDCLRCMAPSVPTVIPVYPSVGCAMHLISKPIIQITYRTLGN